MCRIKDVGTVSLSPLIKCVVSRRPLIILFHLLLLDFEGEKCQ